MHAARRTFRLAGRAPGVNLVYAPERSSERSSVGKGVAGPQSPWDLDSAIHEMLVQAIEEGVRRGVLRALQEAGWRPPMPPPWEGADRGGGRAAAPGARKAVYEFVRAGALRAVRLGHSLRVPEAAVVAWEQGTGEPASNPSTSQRW